jgi:hypothetical protein
MNPHPAPALQFLNPLIGTWKTEGEILGNPATKIQGTDQYEWVSGGFFVLHRVDVWMGDDKVETIELIGGFDAETGTFPMRSFDNQGNFTTMQARVEPDSVFIIEGDGIRSILTIAKDGQSMTARWEQSKDGLNWKPWLDMKFTKIC